ncbi:MAG: tetratricopeptide repeat protein [Chitinophagales bacterium]|nr:tetratricopeptide repeat protein [Chitinophagales bacterium]MDW8393018.1 tetratricopeptide repeat protein [Chitinophagales bacterium]
MLVSALAVMLLYFFGQTKPPAKEPSAAAIAPAERKSVDASLLIEQVRRQLPEGALADINNKEMAIRRTADPEQQAALLARLAESWQQLGHPVMAAHYYHEAYQHQKKEEWLRQAAELFFLGFSFSSDSLTRLYGAQQAAALYSSLFEQDTTQLEFRIRQAVSLIDGMNDVMEGVMLLRQVEQQDPDNEQANVILGRLGIVSGQFDKAIARLEKVTRNNPRNAEAFYHLANAYQAIGRTDDAVAAYETVRQLIDDPEFDAHLGQVIDQIKKK